MTADTQTDTSPSGLAPITDPDTLRDAEGVEFHADTDVAPPEAVEQMAEAEDMAIVGVENEAGEVLLRRLTDTCSWKLPVALVEEGEDYAAAISDHVTETIGALELDAVEGVWHVDVRTEDGEQTASRTFVVFSGTLDDTDLSVPDDGVTEAGWFDELPENGSALPGTELFID